LQDIVNRGILYPEEMESLLAEQTGDHLDRSQLLQPSVESPRNLGTVSEQGAEEYLGHLTLRLEQIKNLQEDVDRLVQLSRAAGASWGEIAKAAGMRPQSAYQRWSDQGNQKHRANQRRRRSESGEASE
jgi:hypothetical protein